MHQFTQEIPNLSPSCAKLSANRLVDFYIFERACFCFDEEFLFHIKRSGVEKEFLISCIDLLHSTVQQELNSESSFKNSILLCITVSLACYLQDSERVKQSFDILQKIKVSKKMLKKVIFIGSSSVDQLSMQVLKAHFTHSIFDIRKFGMSNLLYQICNNSNKEALNELIDFYVQFRKEQKIALYKEIFRLKGIIGEHSWVPDMVKAKDPVDYLKVLHMEKKNIVLTSRLLGEDRIKAIVEFIDSYFSPNQKLELFYTIIKRQRQHVIPVLERLKAQRISNIIHEYPKILHKDIDWISVVKHIVIRPKSNKGHNVGVSAGAVEIVEVLFTENHQKIDFSKLNYLLHNKWKIKYINEMSQEKLQDIKNLSAQWESKMKEIKAMQEITQLAPQKMKSKHKI